jgi:hypothetical protein
MTDDLMQQETADDADFSTLNGALGEIVALRAHAPCGVSGEIHRTAVQAQRLPPENLAGRREALETIKTWAKERYDDPTLFVHPVRDGWRDANLAVESSC